MNSDDNRYGSRSEVEPGRHFDAKRGGNGTGPVRQPVNGVYPNYFKRMLLIYIDILHHPCPFV